MTNTVKHTTKIISLALAIMFLSLPIANIASAHGRRNPPPPPPRHTDRYENHRHHKDNSVSKAHSNRKAITGFLIGAAVGAIVAKNT